MHFINFDNNKLDQLTSDKSIKEMVKGIFNLNEVERFEVFDRTERLACERKSDGLKALEIAVKLKQSDNAKHEFYQFSAIATYSNPFSPEHYDNIIQLAKENAVWDNPKEVQFCLMRLKLLGEPILKQLINEVKTFSEFDQMVAIQVLFIHLRVNAILKSQ